MSTERLVRLAAGIVRAWVWLYTLGLPASVALARREAIASDVWEQTHDPDARGFVALGLDAVSSSFSEAVSRASITQPARETMSSRAPA